ncbi:MAG: response regulator [Desulfobacteraceae bacterium]|jgi:DNA-binding response OmpR family regulator|nr:response regulator [Desulfobacteraceae bacterium]
MQRRLLMATEKRAFFEPILENLVKDGRIQVDWTPDATATLARVRAGRPDLLIVDTRIDGRDGFDLCRKVLQVDAFVNMAAVSDLDDDEFHEASEGLGLVGRLPSRPDVGDLERLLDLLDGVSPPIASAQP